MCELKTVVAGATVAKIDIEGDDAELLEANADFLAMIDMLIFEYWPGGIDGSEYFHQILAAGYDIYDMNFEPRIEPPELTEGCYVNLIGVRQIKEDIRGRA